MGFYIFAEKELLELDVSGGSQSRGRRDESRGYRDSSLPPLSAARRSVWVRCDVTCFGGLGILGGGRQPSGLLWATMVRVPVKRATMELCPVHVYPCISLKSPNLKL